MVCAHGHFSRGLLALPAPWSYYQELLCCHSSNLTATQIPGGAGGHFWDKQTSSSSFREWEPLCLGSKCGGTRLINLAASREECQCLLVRPQRSFRSTQRGLPRLDGLGALDCKAGDAQGELCCIKAMLRERHRFKRPPAEASCRHHTQCEAFHHISADQVKPAGGFCKDEGVCQGWMLWWDEPEWRAATKASEVGGNVDVVCGAVCFLSQLKTLRNMIDPEEGPGDEQDNAGDTLTDLNG